jgi:hypothetical protein
MITGSLAITHDHARAVLTPRDTPDNTGKTPDQKPKRLNNKLSVSLLVAVLWPAGLGHAMVR